MDRLSLPPAKAPCLDAKYLIPSLLFHDVVPATVPLLLHQFFQAAGLWSEITQKCSNKIASPATASVLYIEMSSEDLPKIIVSTYLPPFILFWIHPLQVSFPNSEYCQSHQRLPRGQKLFNFPSLYYLNKTSIWHDWEFFPSLNCLLTCS